VQLKTSWSGISALKGVRANCHAAICHNGQFHRESAGEIQFTDFGVSGPTIFGLSREASFGGDQTLLLDLFRPLTVPEARSMLISRRNHDPNRLLEDFLTGMLHNRLGRVVLTAAGFRLDNRCGDLSDSDVDRIVQKMKFFPLTITGVMGLDQAQVTAGGVRTDEFRPDTLESRICPGLFATGELLDIDGDCGGYNLQWAWSSGYIAGTHASTHE